ncbi:MAG: hypothetical protein Q4B54_13425, partial [Coriobacteriales bacterium]|nr:hypothetical protein [Coriobacteriales bacterium]
RRDARTGVWAGCGVRSLPTCQHWSNRVLHILSSVLVPSPGDSKAFAEQGNVAATNGILLEQNDTIDVLFVGDSEAYSSFSPLQIWGERGFTSYVCATSAQELPYSLSILRLATVAQRPKVVVIETNMLFRPTSIEYGLNQIFQNIFPVFEFHDRWKSFFAPSSEERQSSAAPNATKGFATAAASNPADVTNYMAADDQVTKIPSRNELYLRLMIDHCRRIGATPLLVSTPSTVNWNTARHNGIVLFAKEAKVDYVDLNVAPTKVAIDWTTDTHDAGDHMNLSGAKKVSAYMGAYLAKTYGLVDRRGDANYKAWNEAFARNKQAL